MAKPYSMDLRERVVAAVEKDGLSWHQAAARFGVGVSTAINWVRRYRETGSVAPGQMGGHKPKAIRGEHHAWLVDRIKDGDFTLRGLVGKAAERTTDAVCSAIGELLDQFNTQECANYFKNAGYELT